MTKLPRQFLDTSTLENMQVGETRYTLPWGMRVDADLECWLHPKYPANCFPGGTVQMRVERRKDGYHVWPPAGESYSPGAGYGSMSPDDTAWIPVAEVH